MGMEEYRKTGRGKDNRERKKLTKIIQSANLYSERAMGMEKYRKTGKGKDNRE